MAVPKFFEFFNGFLNAVKDGELHSAKEVREVIVKDMCISDIDLLEMLPSGKQSTFNNRVAWARTYLDKAGLIETPVRGKYRITSLGIKALESDENIDLKYLEKSEKFKEFHNDTHKMLNSDSDETVESPIETLDLAYNQIVTALASQLMDEVMNLTS